MLKAGGLVLAFLSVALFLAAMPVPTPRPSPSQVQGQQSAEGSQKANDSGTETQHAAITPSADLPTADHQNQGSEQHKTFWEWVAGFFSEVNFADVAIALFTGMLWWSTRALWRETKRLATLAETQSIDMKASIAVAEKAAKAAIASASVAEKTLIATDRPWIIIEHDVAGPLVFGADTITATVRFRLRNVGKSPATNVLLYSAMHSDCGVAKIEVSQSILGHSPATGAFLGWGQVIYPGCFIERERELELSRQVFLDRIAEIAATPIDEEPGLPPAARFTHSHPGVNVLVYYGLPNAPRGKARHTMLVLEFDWIDHPIGFDGSEQTIPADRLLLEQSFSAAGEAS